MRMTLPPTTLRVDTLDVMHVTEENAEEFWLEIGHTEQIVISADLVVRGAVQVRAATYLGVDRIMVMTVAEFQEQSNT